MNYEDEREFEASIRKQIKNKITKPHPGIYALENKKAVDIILCKDTPKPSLYFLEVKFHKQNHGRLGFGHSKGGGFQPELLKLRPTFFERNLRWVLASEIHQPGRIWFVDSETIRAFVAGGEVGPKFNNIQTKLFKEHPSLSRDEFVQELLHWVGASST